MCDYGRVPPEFWTGIIGRKLRGDSEAQIVALYLMTAPAANMIGVYRCPVLAIAHDTGLNLEAASKGLERLINANFCTYSKRHELVWVHEMARFQIAAILKPRDKRVIGIRRVVEKIPDPTIKRRFFKKYGVAFRLNGTRQKRRLWGCYEGHRFRLICIKGRQMWSVPEFQRPHGVLQ